MHMVRTQIYLTKDEQRALRALARRTGRTRSQLIREAVDALIARSRNTDRREMLEQARGIWKDREPLPDFRRLRQEIDRSAPDSD